MTTCAKCVVGFDESDWDDEDKPRLVYEGDERKYIPDIYFTFCPICGARIEWSQPIKVVAS